MWRLWTRGWGVREWWRWVTTEGFPMWVAWRVPHQIALWTFIRVYAKGGQAPGPEYTRVYDTWQGRIPIRGLVIDETDNVPCHQEER